VIPPVAVESCYAQRKAISKWLSSKLHAFVMSLVTSVLVSVMVAGAVRESTPPTAPQAALPVHAGGGTSASSLIGRRTDRPPRHPGNPSGQPEWRASA